MRAFIEALKDDTCTPKPAKLNAWVYTHYLQYKYIYIHTQKIYIHIYLYIYADILYITYVISLYCDLNV